MTQHPDHLKYAEYFLSYIDESNKEDGPFDKEKPWFISRDKLNYLPSCGTGMCFKAVGQLLDFWIQNFSEKQGILDALAVAMTSNTFCLEFSIWR